MHTGPACSLITVPGYCVYQGVYYKQGQTWDDGCAQKCRCEDVNTGYYSCRERCPSFDNLPPTCKLVTDANDPCCLVPDCNSFPTPLPNGQTPVPGAGPTPPKIFTPTPAPTGIITGTGTGTGGQSGFCVYDGKQYGFGQQWNDGCNFKCECIDAVRGQFRCTDRCNQYYGQLPKECYKQPDPNDQCCQKVTCNFGTTLTPPPSYTPVVTPSGTPGPVVVVTDKCTYTNGNMYKQGSTWNDGCSDVCECVDAQTNYYKCTQRCPVFSSLPQTCTLQQDPDDTCCMTPTCTGTLKPMIGGGGPTASPTLAPSVTDVFPVGRHTTITGSELPPQASPGPVTSGRRVGCVYKNKQYRQGDAWNDGCDYVCSCVNENQGIYKCTSKCPVLPPLPSYCQILPIPGQCCKTVSCNLPGEGKYSPVPELTPDLIPTPGPVPTPGQTTPKTFTVLPLGPSTTGGSSVPGGGYKLPPGTGFSGIRDKCISNDNRTYNQGESWQQGCDFNCTCLDGRTGYYTCMPLCPTYDSLPTQCFLEKTTGCCMKPKCRDDNGNPVDPDQNPTLYPVVGSVTGGFTGFRPGFLENTPTYMGGQTGPGCIFKNKFYQEGDKWDDGCDFTCTCQDGARRRYVCNPKCKQFVSIPPGYQLVPDPQGCCEILTRPTMTSTQMPVTPAYDPNCVDARPDCDLYGSAGTAGCIGEYAPWAQVNCRRTCGYCPTVAPNLTPTPGVTPAPTCQDAISNCADYGLAACTGDYVAWANQNCQKFCGICKEPTGNCFDALDNCGSIGNFYCTGIYRDWARTNCNSTCNLCGPIYVDPILPGKSGNDSSTHLINGKNVTFGKVSQVGWMTLLKGVSGAPGDLLGLWRSNQTKNEMNPNAMELTNRLPENYKPAISNYWDDCKFKYVKLSVMTGNQENAYILFDAQGTNKMSWFDPSRIVNSSFTDIKGANFDKFSADGDPNTGRHFVITQSTQSCDVKGWLFMSTREDCFYERGTKPTFHYSTTNSSGQFGVETKKADIFVLSGYDGQCTNITRPDKVACTYNGTDYNTGDTWQDGCQKKCTCVDAALSFYKCEDLCPTIRDLPVGCRIVKKDGNCCGDVVCDGKRGCYYKGYFYNQDEQWDDGCDYHCTCVDAYNGFYQCSAKCLVYKNLPTECSLQAPAQGKCCPVVRCPPGIVVNLPDDYVPQ